MFRLVVILRPSASAILRESCGIVILSGAKDLAYDASELALSATKG
jgi:hypothetical protein